MSGRWAFLGLQGGGRRFGSCDSCKMLAARAAGALPTPPSPTLNTAGGGVGSRKLAHQNCPHCPQCPHYPLEKCNDVHCVPCRRLPICSLHKHSDAYKCSHAAGPGRGLCSSAEDNTYKSAICPGHGDHRFPVLGVENGFCCAVCPVANL